ncbi:hypothetical protein L198_06973 [Cryptococcus wingfieldii CBS 7118]|uniref:Carboxylesterase type B domain-containing protein n=1 Tax=Cryptococcus wingfieldii CBS 7118 TaxID=1295528 RepID=A0A1E3IGN0_9TREE|nr:hypothetical protein L198_06973 [Cryptococcus wingfieldii CBS 7118]ODN87743.1 hypothetical protein L198_06973 [Cryptococcus wingfieldii CBS 7118]
MPRLVTGFSRPETYVYNDSSYTAQTQPSKCLQDDQMTGGLDCGPGSSEDCLFLNVFFAPAKIISEAKLPLMVWMHGGSLTAGSVFLYNGASFIAYSQEVNKPIIHVALDYRLGVFGWGMGSGFAEQNATSLGLQDIKKFLLWVEEYIEAFGGDPEQVTVYSESAGAIATSLLLLDPSTDLLFKQAVTALNPPSRLARATPPLLLASNCSNSNGSSPFECLRNLSGEELPAAQISLKNQSQFRAGGIYGPSVDGDLIPDSPHELLRHGQVADKPFITGCNKDEATEFIPTSVSGEAFGEVLFKSFYPADLSPQTLKKLTQDYYPNDPALGSPFDTGNETFGLDPSLKQFAAILGDALFQAQRRHFLRQANSHGNAKTWTYQFEQPIKDMPAYTGVHHTAEIAYVYGTAKPEMGLPLAGFAPKYTGADTSLSEQIMDYWLNSAYDSDPNGLTDSSSSDATYWCAHNVNDKHILRLIADNTITRPLSKMISEKRV